ERLTLFLDALLLRDVLGDAGSPRDAAVVREDGEAGVADPADAAIRWADNPVFGYTGLSGERPRHDIFRVGPVLLVDQLVPSLNIVHDLFTRLSPRVLVGRAEIFQLACFGTGDPERVGRGLREPSEQGFARPQACFRTKTLGHIGEQDGN